MSLLWSDALRVVVVSLPTTVRGGCLAINYVTTGMPLMPPGVYCKTISAIPAAWHTAWAPPLQAHIR